MTRQIRLFIYLATALVTVFAPRAGLAEKRIVVLGIEGAPSGELRDTVAGLIRTEHRVIAGSMYRRAAERLEAVELTPENMAKVAASLDADGVLVGVFIRKSKRRYVLRMRLHAGVDGEVVEKLTLRLRAPRLGKRMKAKVRAGLLPAIDELPLMEEDGRGPLEPAPAPAPEPPESKAVEAAEAKVVPLVSATADPVREGATPEEATSGESASVPGAAHVRSAAASLHLGASVVSRDLLFTTTPEDFAQAPQGYEGPVAPGVYASGELYPLAFMAEPGSVLSMIGFGFEVDRVLGLRTAIDSGATVTYVPTTQMRYSLGLRVRYNIGNKPTRPTVKLGIGMGQLSFVLDENSVPLGVMLDVPNTAYSYLDPGLSVHVPLSARVALTGAGRFLLITDAGDVQKQDQYGSATLLGVSAQAGVEVMATSHVLVRLAGAYTAVSFDFAGNGFQTNSRDGDDTTQDVDSALDRYIGGVASVGYLF